MTGQASPLYGVLAEFSTPGALLAACEAAREAGFRRWDAHSPYPVHGLERAMGLARSPVPWFVFVLGMSGAAGGMLLQWWVSTTAYPLVVSGKPLFSWPAFVPVMFECGVLGGALGAVLGFLLLSRLPRHHHPLFNVTRFESVTDDRFFISIEAADERFDVERTPRWLTELGAAHVELVAAEAPPPPLPPGTAAPASRVPGDVVEGGQSGGRG